MKIELLLDTHIIIWMATSSDGIPKRLLAAIETADLLFVSHVTATVIQLKHLKNSEAFPFGPPREEFQCFCRSGHEGLVG